MRSRLLAVSAFLVIGAPSALALAQQPSPNCPPGGWFCEDSSPPAATTAPPPALPPPSVMPPPETAPAPSPSAPPATTVIVPGSRSGPPPVVIYQQAPPPPPSVYVVRRSPRVVVPPPPPPPVRTRWRRWGLNLRLEGVMMDDRQSQTSGMGGVGMSFRARPNPYFALDFGLDTLGGRDYHGNTRSEVPFTISAMVYANPRNPVQFYMLGGIGWSTARVEYDSTAAPASASSSVTAPYTVERYSYFGGQLGGGLEFRLSPPVSLNIDLVGFIRGRTDSQARDYPEFRDEQGRTTNSSGGGLFRAGLTFYW